MKASSARMCDKERAITLERFCDAIPRLTSKLFSVVEESVVCAAPLSRVVALSRYSVGDDSYLLLQEALTPDAFLAIVDLLRFGKDVACPCQGDCRR